MTRRTTLLLLTAAVLGLPRDGVTISDPTPLLRTGDVVFHASRSAQSSAIQYATQSPYSHVGIVERTKGGIFVVEAVQPVKRTGWKVWKARGERSRVMVARVRGLDDVAAKRVVATASGWIGRPYDLKFEPGDERLYCSELVRKAFQRGAGVTIGKLEPIGGLRLPGIAAALAERYGSTIPTDQEVVTPASLAADPLLDKVYSDFD